jgi:nucleotide-binding universal stress UspA family protein
VAHRILLALDESGDSLRAARAAVALFPDAEFLVVNVARVPVPWMPVDEFGTVGAVPPPDFDQIVVAADANARAEVAAVAEEAHVKATEVLIEHGDPVDAIAEAAEAHDVDIVVVGSHDKSGLARLFSRSVAAGVVHRVHRPVLVVSGEEK